MLIDYEYLLLKMTKITNDKDIPREAVSITDLRQNAETIYEKNAFRFFHVSDPLNF
jgi:hypothetical protein